MSDNKEKPYTRPDNLVEALFGGNYKGLTDDERLMRMYLEEEYKKRGMGVIEEVKKWREEHPDADLGGAIRALFEVMNKES